MTNSLLNADLAPVEPEHRGWSTWNIAALWIGMSVCIPTYAIAANMIAAGMNWWQAVITVLLGNLIVLIPMILNGHGGTKYGVPFPVLVRSCFGINGAHVAAIARGLVACGWFGIQSWIGGWAIYQALGALHIINVASDVEQLPVLGITALQFFCFLVFWAINLGIVVTGVSAIRILETWAAPFLLACGMALLIWAFVKIDKPEQLFEMKSNFDSRADFMKVFVPQLTAMVGFWATLSLNIPDFTRYCRSQKEQALGQLLGLPTTMAFFCFIGIVVTNATIVVFGNAIWDPVELIAKIGSPAVVAISLFALTIATLSTNLAANVVSPANGFANLAPTRISFRTGAIITCLIGLIIMPWKLYNDPSGYIFVWLIGYSALLGPIAGIMLCDYFILRRTRLDLEGLYQKDGPYKGVNVRAMVAMVIAVLPNIPGFINAITGRTHAAFDAESARRAALDSTVGLEPIPAPYFPEIFDTIYDFAWFVGLGLAAIIYFILAVGRVKPAPKAAGDIKEFES